MFSRSGMWCQVTESVKKCTKLHSAEGVLYRTMSNGKFIFKTKAAGTLKGLPTDMWKEFIQSLAVRETPDSFPMVSNPEQHYNVCAARQLVDSILKKALDT